jgi:hypothetical protein
MTITPHLYNFRNLEIASAPTPFRPVQRGRLLQAQAPRNTGNHGRLLDTQVPRSARAHARSHHGRLTDG